MDGSIDIGMVGLGKMGIAHMAILNALDGARVTCAAEKQGITKKGITTVLPSVRLFDDYREMLEREPLDAVFITSPTALHVPVAARCLERGLPFFVEKPLGLSAGECEGLVATASDQAIPTMVGYCKHFVETFERAREILCSGELGTPVYFSSHMYVSQLFRAGSGWRYKKESSGGGVLNILATHLVDVLVWFFGGIDKVFCATGAHYSKEVEDFVNAYLTFSSGLAGSLDASWSIRGYRLPEIDVTVQCEGGMLQVTEDYVRYMLDSDERYRVLYRQDLFEGVPVYVGGSEYTREDLYFLDCLRDGRTPALDVAYGYRLQQVTDAMYRSAASGREETVGGGKA
ncbi:MAG: Gfo/Idh/MocA family oxidoreductase [Actinobacteria bacterium]|nr:Gfo/Idh/MocA family oxidoreductase [Actinomycetota bacterium]